MIETMGASTMIYPLKNVVRLVALARIFHGAVAQPPTIEVRKAPLRMLIHLGARNAKSLLAAMELVEMFVPRVARPNANAQKKAPARLSQREMMDVGSQYSLP